MKNNLFIYGEVLAQRLLATTRAKSKLIIVKLNNYNANCFQNSLQEIFSKRGHDIEDVATF